MRVLVTWGSNEVAPRIARTVGETLRAEGCEVDLLPPREATKTTTFDAAIVGGALYAGRWHHAARKFVGTWVPFALIGAVTWTIGEVIWAVPPPKRSRPCRRTRPPADLPRWPTSGLQARARGRCAHTSDRTR